MKIFFRLPNSDNGSLHQNLLETSLFNSFQKLVPSHFKGVYASSVKFTHADLYPVRSAIISKRRQADKAISVGIVPDTENQLGDVILVCTQSLAKELEQYSKIYAPDKHLGEEWVVTFLRGFKKIIFLNRFDYADSIGFTPWVKMELVDHYPIHFDSASEVEEGLIKVVIINHDSASDYPNDLDEVFSNFSSVCKWDFLHNESVLTEADQRQLLADADIHYHMNYSNQVRSLISPFDSILNGVYTLIEPIKHKKTLLIDQELIEMVKERSYSYINSKKDDLNVGLADILRRINVLRAETLEEGSPETVRYKGPNRAVQDLKLSFLLEALNK